MTNYKDMKIFVYEKKDFWFQQKDIEHIPYTQTVGL